MDFFAGSGTTANAVIKANLKDGGNRKYILVQLPEILDSQKNEHKLAISFCQKLKVPQVISELSKERIRRVLKKEREDNDLDSGFKSFKLSKSCFREWDDRTDTTQEALIKQIQEQIDYIDPDASTEDILYELLLKDGFSLTTPIETLDIDGKTIYSIENGALLICLEKQLTENFMDELANLEPTPSRIICLDAGFQGNDELKCNTVHIFKTKALHEDTTIDFFTV